MKILTVIKRELLTRTRTKGFVFFTFGIPLLAAGLIFLEYQIVQASQNVSSNIAVVDLSQSLYPELSQVITKSSAQAATEGGSRFHLTQVEATAATLPQTEDKLRQQVLAKSLNGYLVIPADVLTSRTAQYHALNAAAFAVRADLSSALRQAVNRSRMLAAGVPAAQLDSMAGSFDLNQLKVSATGDSRDNGQTAILAIVLITALYLVMLLYGVVVMRAVTEEKTTRISEVLLSAVDPFSLMLGKVLGVVATALVQLAVWGLCLGLFVAYGLTMLQAAGINWTQYLPHDASWLYVCFILFFIAGFLLYASIYAAIGSVVSSEQEAQQTQMPLTIVLVIGFYLAFYVMANPTTLTSVVLSFIPFFAPVLMVTRVAVSNPPVWQVLASFALCIATFFLCTRITAKIYRVGILMTGKRPTLPELLRWLKYA